MRLLRIGLVIALVAGGGWWFWHHQHPDILAVSVAPVTRGVVEASVANTRAGTVKACRRAQMSPSIG